MRALALAAVLGAAATAAAQPVPRPMQVDVDARDVGRRVLHSRVTIPLAAGPQTLLYPKWLPGEHGPTGPIVNLAGVQMSVRGKALPWRRDAADMYAFHVDVPAGAEAVVVLLDFLVPTTKAGFSSGASATPELAMISWNELLLYPKDAKPDELQVAATLRFPAGWKFGGALPVPAESPTLIKVATSSLTRLVDSPMLIGAHTRTFQLRDKPPVRIFAAADDDAVLEMPPATLAAYQKLAAEASALFGAEHFRSYTFLYTLSDEVASFGLEHHESSDDRLGERALIDEDHRREGADLLPHEMVHSWNGKYRRPAGLAPGRFDEPMNGELLWIYEGLTQYLGEILTARSGLWTPDEYRESLARTAAEMDVSKGRSWRPLADTAVAAQILYGAPNEGAMWRRGVDFYPEGSLLWLEVDTMIRQQTGGKASLDDFCKKFHGPPSGPPTVKPYVLDDVVAALNEVAPRDWKAFFQERVYTPQPRAPLGGVEAAGWAVTYVEKLPPLLKSIDTVHKTTEERFSIGILVREDGIIPDVVPGSPADQAGVAPGAKLIAVNGRRYTSERLRDAVRDSKRRKAVELVTDNSGIVTQHTLKYAGGPRFPMLERVAGKPDVLGAIIAPVSKP